MKSNICLALAVGMVVVAITLIMAGSMRTGLCRPCHEKGIKRRIYRVGIPEKWECWRH